MSGSPVTESAPSPAGRPVADDGAPPTVRVTYRKSAIGYSHDQKATIAALGLHRLHQTVEHPDTPALRGMVHKVRHLVSLDPGPEGAVPAGGGDPAEEAPRGAGGRRR